MHRAALVSLCVLLSLGLAHGHGGGLHRWTFNPDVLEGVPTASVRNDVNVKVATCDSWTALNLTALTPSSFTLPWFPAQLNMTLSGVVDVHSYLSNNCTSSINSGLFPYLNFTVWTRSGENTWVPRPAPATITASGYGFEGSCSAPGNLYRNNATLQDNRFNLAFWGYEHQVGVGMNASDAYPGLLWGSAPNSWFVRNATQANRMRSILIFAQSGPVFCCNLNYTGFPSGESVLSMGKDCSTPAAHGRRLFEKIQH